MPIDRSEILFSLCVEDIITVLEERFNLDFNSLSEKHQEELIRSGKKAYEIGLDWGETSCIAIQDFIEENNLADTEEHGILSDSLEMRKVINALIKDANATGLYTYCVMKGMANPVRVTCATKKGVRALHDGATHEYSKIKTCYNN
jgi:hypothetical protein